MARMVDVEAGLELAYRKALADYGEGRVSRDDLMVAGRGLGYQDIETDLDINVRNLPKEAGRDDVIVVLRRDQVRRNGGQQ